MNDTTINFGMFVLKNYGLFGLIIILILLFSGWIFNRIVSHFISAIDRKDIQLVEVQRETISAIDNNTRATHALHMSVDKLTNWIDNDTKENKRDHEEILSRIRMIK